MPILTPEERVGTEVAGKYRLERIVAGGGMATVYAGMHGWTHRAVAVKILNYEYARDEEIVRRFLQEARAASQLKHANVVDVLDMGRDPDGTVYLVMELLEGETLKSRMRRGVSIDDFATLLAPVMRAVARAHEKGVTHRDLKPDNVFLADGEDGTITPKLLDFGIAKVASGGDSSTRTGVMVGTPHYMAPEQVRGERDVGPPADVWSMGVVLFACLAGRLPFEAESAPGVIAKVLVERPPSLAALAPGAPAEIVAVVERALERDPGQRFTNMGEMLGALEDALASARRPRASASAAPVAAQVAAAPTLIREPDPHTTVEPPSAPTPFVWAAATPPAEPSSGRRRVLVAGVAIAAVAVAAISAGTWWAMAARPETTATPLPVTAGHGPAGETAGGAGAETGSGPGAGAGTEMAGETGAGSETAAGAETAGSGTGAEAERETEAGTAAEAESTTAGQGETTQQETPETAAGGERAADGETAAQGERAADGERAAQGERAAGGERAADGERAAQGERAGAGSGEARPRAPRAREPRRGTRGALILH